MIFLSTVSLKDKLTLVWDNFRKLVRLHKTFSVSCVPPEHALTLLHKKQRDEKRKWNLVIPRTVLIGRGKRGRNPNVFCQKEHEATCQGMYRKNRKRASMRTQAVRWDVSEMWPSHHLQHQWCMKAGQCTCSDAMAQKQEFYLGLLHLCFLFLCLMREYISVSVAHNRLLFVWIEAVVCGPNSFPT